MRTIDTVMEGKNTVKIVNAKGWVIASSVIYGFCFLMLLLFLSHYSEIDILAWKLNHSLGRMLETLTLLTAVWQVLLAPLFICIMGMAYLSGDHQQTRLFAVIPLLIFSVAVLFNCVYIFQ